MKGLVYETSVLDPDEVSIKPILIMPNTVHLSALVFTSRGIEQIC